MLNSAVAESLRIYADRLEGADDFESALHEMIRKTIKDHARIVFNGNGYDDAWIDEAVNVRGLHNLKTTPDCMPRLLDEKNVAMLTSHGVFTVAEMESRTEIMLENYCNSIEIEAATMINMARTEIAPAVGAYLRAVAETAAVKRSVAPRASLGCEAGLIERLSGLVDRMFAAADELEEAVSRLDETTCVVERSEKIRDEVLPAMDALRAPADEAETLTAKTYWPFPTYGDLLFGVR